MNGGFMTKKILKLGAMAGGMSGLVGAVLVSEYNFSLVVVMIIGALIGAGVGMVAKMFGKKKQD